MIAPTFNWDNDRALYAEWGRYPEVGFHLGVPFDIYLSWDAMSNSAMKPLGRSPGHYQHSLLFPWEGSKQADIGSASDLGWLESPALVPRQFATPPVITPRKKNGEPYSNWLVSTPGKAWKADMKEAGITVLSVDEAFQVFGIMLAMSQHEEAMELRRGAATQVSIVWDHPVTVAPGEVMYVRCKGRFDILGGMDGDPPYKPADMKTTTVVIDPLSDRDPFAKQAGILGYDRQAGHYCDGLTVLTGVPHTEFPLIVVEQAAPHPVAVYDIDPGDIEAAQAEIDDLLLLYVDCKASGQWPCSVAPLPGEKHHKLHFQQWTREVR